MNHDLLLSIDRVESEVSFHKMTDDLILSSLGL